MNPSNKQQCSHCLVKMDFGKLLLLIGVISWVNSHLLVGSGIVHGEDTNNRSAGEPYCVDLSQDDSICSTDPVDTLNRVYSKNSLDSFNVGIAQTIDGTEEEKRNIENVLQLMNKYWNEEILANFDYEEVRSTCKNKNKLCAFWASVGECESNRVFMLPNCALACRFCLLQHADLVPTKSVDAMV